MIASIFENLFQPVTDDEHMDRIPEETYKLVSQFEEEATELYNTEFQTRASASRARQKLYQKYDLKDASIGWYRIYWELVDPNCAARLRLRRTEKKMVELYKEWKKRDN